MPSDTPTNLPIQTVSELSGALKRTIEQAFSYVRVRGEISGFKRHGSGHLYLALKDADAVIDAVCWRPVAARLAIRPEDGMEVIATGRLTAYPGRSKYQLVIESLELAGEGALLKLLEDRKRRLAAEGLFDETRKRKLPFLPEIIGVITSPTGAVIRDILHRLADRFPRRVLLWPVAVQGEGAAQQIAAAIEGFNRLAPGGAVPRPDLLIVARGGGSLEDLMAFNEEIVVRAAAASAIPLISAVGHETDTTLIDFASDQRAPTPTAAAEMAVPVRLDLLTDLRSQGNRLEAGISRLFREARLSLDGLARGLPDLASLLDTATQRLDERGERLDVAAKAFLAVKAAHLAATAARLTHPRHLIAEQERHLAGIAARLGPASDRAMDRAGERLGQAAARLAAVPLGALVERGRADLDQRAQRLAAARFRTIDLGRERLSSLGQILESLSPLRVLERGYAVVEDAGRHPIPPEAITTGMALSLRFHTSRVAVRAEGGAKPLEAGGARESGAERKTAVEERQARLL